MQTRHRIPTIFNLSMVDVLCCALGCVILLWLVYFKEARSRAVTVGQTSQQLTAAKGKLEDLHRELTAAQKLTLAGNLTNQQLSGQLLEVTAQRDQLLAKWEKSDREHLAALRDLKDARLSIAALRKDVKDLQTLNATINAVVAQKTKDHESLTLKFLDASQKITSLEKTASTQNDALAAAAGQTADLKSRLADAENRHAQAAKDHAIVTAKLTGTEKDHAIATAKFVEANQKIGNLEKTIGTQKTTLLDAAGQAADLQAKLATAEKLAGKLEKDVTAQQILAKEYSDQLAKLEVRAAGLATDLDKRKLDVNASNKRFEELQALKNVLEQSLAAARNDLSKAEKELAAFKLANQSLIGETTLLKQDFNKLKVAAENRFAGIELTGQRVLFLVDMSGSMRMKDHYVEDPDKWPLACEILGKLIQSLPDLKEFQIILFSDAIRYPLGNKGKWYQFNGPATVKTAIDAVRAVTPQNETNMSIVFEEAFRFRTQGLDTIYLLSDGLPNTGDGLPGNGARLSEADKSALLTKYIRDRLKSIWNAPQGADRKQRVRINTVGFYFDSPDVGAFLWALARDNDGSFVGLSKP